jgi:hypothetical protein
MGQLVRRIVIAAFFVLVTTMTTEMTAQAQIGVHIGVDLPVFPRLVVVPGYPVYYAPAVRANYFFYDGLFWVFNVDDGYWYSSSWYNGPWVVVEPEFVPQPILVVPYRYYRVRPVYWGGWAYDRPPRWDVYWGPTWVEHHHGWDHWDRSRRISAAPLPVFQRQYDRSHYPSPAQQVTIYRERYNYRPRDVVVRERQTTIIDRQARGGERASARAAFLEQRNENRAQRQANVQENRQTRENIREQDRARRQDNVQQNRQREENLREQRQSNVQQNRQTRENLREQNKAQRDANVQQNRQSRENLNAQDRARRDANVQENRQTRENLREQNKAQREANVQQNRQSRENLNAQDRGRRQENVQENRQSRENVREQNKSQRQANVQERGARERKAAPEKGTDERG